MILNTKCLWTLTVTVYLWSVSNNLCYSKSTYEVLEDKQNAYDELQDGTQSDRSRNDMIEDEIANIATAEQPGWSNSIANWDKSFIGSDLDNKGESDVSIAQISPNKRKWSKFASWGKRDFASNGQGFNDKREMEDLAEPLNIDPQHSTDKRKWHGLSSWGKRTVIDAQFNPEDIDKRKWQFTSWGKRDDGQYMDKRKWSKFASWGKRNDDRLQEDLDKRARWSKFASWGKRSDLSNDIESEKRKWSKFASWGKREDDGAGLAEDGIWSIPTSQTNGDVPLAVDKRNWSKFASWGKRPRNPQAWLALNTWGKRRWTGLNTWGKRSGSGYKVEGVARRLLNLFDLNGDGALDFNELYQYIRTLMSLPSKPETEVQIPVETK